MGVKGLTTYISQRSEIFLKDYVFPHNSLLVIDGDSVALNIYVQLENRSSCFGGDYDRYAKEVRVFLEKLSDSQVTPYVLFDGATAPGKVKTAIRRLNERIQNTIQINCLNDDAFPCPPLSLTEVFKGILKERNIAIVTCDFECDKEVANIAHQLNCPLLSYDSDYFIYDVKYIPFVLNGNHQNLSVFSRLGRNAETNRECTLHYLKCKIFDRDAFLRRTGLSCEKLPILTIYLGNDYIERVENVPDFCRYLNLCCGNFAENIINWLAEKSPTEAITKMMGYCVTESNRQKIKTLIEEQPYTCAKSKFLKYLQCTSTSKFEPDSCMYLKHISETFIDKYRRGFYHHNSMDILVFHKYFLKPLVDNINKPHSHTSSFPIINAIHKILTNNSTNDLFFYGRVGYHISEQVIKKSEKKLPTYDEIEEMNIQEKINNLLKILEIERKFKQDCLDLFPNSWHILLITLKYMNKTCKIEFPFISAVVLSKIILSHVDKKLGYIRSWKEYVKFAMKYKDAEKNMDFTHVMEAVDGIDRNDSLKAVEKLLTCFELSSDMEYIIYHFNRNIVHIMSEFQSCFLHVDLLNDIFDMPFEKSPIWELYNGTFIYNLFHKLQYDDMDFIHNSLKTSPTFLKCFVFIETLLKNQFA